VNKYIITALPFNEPKAFFPIKPFYCSVFHVKILS
jgi:hypothetical protein